MFGNIKSSHQEVEVFFQVDFLQKKLWGSSSLAELYTQSSVTENRLTDCFVEQFEEYIFFEDRLLGPASKTLVFDHMQRMSQRGSLFLVSRKLLKWVNKVHHEKFFSDFLENIVLTRNSIS